MDPESISDVRRALLQNKPALLDILKRYKKDIQISDLDEEFVQRMFFPLKNEEEYFESLRTCKVCKGTKVNYVEAQNRSTDEGAKITFTCISCKHTWTEF